MLDSLFKTSYYFNTSYVVVQVVDASITLTALEYFNTSYVVVQELKVILV